MALSPAKPSKTEVNDMEDSVKAVHRKCQIQDIGLSRSYKPIYGRKKKLDKCSYHSRLWLVCSPSNRNTGWDLKKHSKLRNVIFSPIASTREQVTGIQSSISAFLSPFPVFQKHTAGALSKSLHRRAKKSLFPLSTICLKFWGCFSPEHWQSIYIAGTGRVPGRVPQLSICPNCNPTRMHFWKLCLKIKLCPSEKNLDSFTQRKKNQKQTTANVGFSKKKYHLSKWLKIVLYFFVLFSVSSPCYHQLCFRIWLNWICGFF